MRNRLMILRDILSDCVRITGGLNSEIISSNHPTALFDWHGHVNCLAVDVYLTGYEKDVKPEIRWYLYVDRTDIAELAKYEEVLRMIAEEVEE